MVPPAALLLDFGGVIWDMRWDVCRALEARHGLPAGSVFETLYRTPVWAELQCGRGDREAWLEGAHRALEALAGRPLPPLHAEWRASQHPIPATLALVRALRPTYRVGVLSNADRTLRERLAQHVGIEGLFDDVVCSAEVGLAKPDPAIFRLACARIGASPPACVFVDDHGPNVEAARAVGLRAVLHRVDRGDDLRAQLVALGMRVPPAAGA